MAGAEGVPIAKNAPGRWARIRASLPQGSELPHASWLARHRFILAFIAAHVPLLALYGFLRGWPVGMWLGEPALVALIGAAAAWPRLSPRLRSALSGLALVTCSAILVQFSGGYIEAHFHYFIVVALVALYEDYVPFLLAIGYVAIDHGVVGSIAPQWVYNHPAGAGTPWAWAGIHAAAILGESVALLGFWAGSQQVRTRSDTVLHSTGEGILGTDLQDSVTFVNPAATTLLGKPSAALIGKPLRDVLPGTSGATGGAAPMLGVSHVQRSTGAAVLEWSVTPAQRNGVVLGSVVALRDITGRRRLEDQAVSHARQQATIARLGQFALETRDLDVIFTEAVRNIAETLGTPLCGVLQAEPDGRHLRVRTGLGWTAPTSSLPRVSNSIASFEGYAFAAQAPVIVADLQADARFAVAGPLADEGAASGIGVAIQASRSPWGVLLAQSRERRGYSADEANFLQSVANLLASAIERDRAEQALHTRNRQQAAVAALGHEALLADSLDAFLARCARDVSTALDVEYCKILELEPGGDTLLLRAGHGWRAGLVGAARVPADLTSQAGYALRHDGPVIVRDVATESRFAPPALLAEHGVVSGMSVLIKGRDRPFGVLGAHGRSLREFTHDDIHFLQAVANLVATTIERDAVGRELAEHRLDLEGLVERRTTELTAANRELEAFSYTVSHDLRSPLRSIDGFSRLLRVRHGKDLPPDAIELLDLVHRNALRMGDLIESVLTLARISRAELEPRPVDLSALAIEILQELRRQAPDRDVVWEVEPGLATRGDEGLLRLALQNLLANAWKFTGKTHQARIRVGRHASKPDVVVVEDNGAGFDMSGAGQLFKPFHRLHRPADFPGTGVGLATVSRIVQRHGGAIWAESTPGQGARFLVQLPALGNGTGHGRSTRELVHLVR